MKSITKNLAKLVKNLNNSKIFAGLALIVLNLGSKHVDLDFTPAQLVILRHTITRQLLIFAIAWIGSRDIYAALTITCGYVILTEILLNSNSDFNVLPESLKKLETVNDENNDGIIQEKELEKAIEIINKHKKNIRKK